MWGGFHQADRSVWCCHVGSPDDRKATAAVRSFCWLFFPVAFAEYISECNKSRHLEHSITLILVDIRVYLSCHWWLLVWSHVWRWRHIGPNMPQLWTGSLCEELSSSVSSFLCDSVAVWARGLVVNLCFAKVCVIARNSTTHLLTFSQSLKDFIGIDSFYRDLDPAFRHLPPSSTIFHHLPPQKDEATMEQMATAAAATLEQWHCQNCDLSQCLAVITFNSWPCQRRTRIEKIEVQTHDILGVPYQANPALWICTIFVSVPLWSSMYCVCMYMHYIA